MNAPVPFQYGTPCGPSADPPECAGDPQHALAAGGPIETLLAQHAAAAAKIRELADLMNKPDGLGEVVGFFIEGNAGKEALHRAIYVSRLFRSERALMALDAAYWRRALEVTNLFELLPEERRALWRRRLESWKTREPAPGAELPRFEPAAVRKTLAALMALRPRYLAERVDGVFRALSPKHATNLREGFNRRMILARVVDAHGSICPGQAGHIADLRGVVAKFFNNPDPSHDETSALIRRALARPGEWLAFDGNALRMRAHRAGTVHIEVHPHLAQRLNAVLGALHPLALPERFRALRRFPKAAPIPLQRPLPFPVRYLLESAPRDCATGSVTLAATFQKDEAALPAARIVLEMLGGVATQDDVYAFASDPSDALDEIGIQGVVPRAWVGEFVPTTPVLAARAIELAQIDSGHECLEPSAGGGGIAKLLPRPQTTVVERSALHCARLHALGYEPHQADFLEWAGTCRGRFARIVMHPPHEDWLRHLCAAAQLAAPDARLVALLPAGVRGIADDSLKGWDCSWEGCTADWRDANYPVLVLLCATRCERASGD